MPLNLFPVCFRGRNDCEPIDCVDAAPEGLTEQQMMECDYTPHSFVCSGCSTNPKIKQDQYRLCFKNDETDEMTDNDLQDLTSIIKVVGTALCLDSVRKVASGICEIPAEQSKIN